MVLKQLGMASVSIQAGVEGFLELEPNSNTRFLSGRTVHYIHTRKRIEKNYVPCHPGVQVHSPVSGLHCAPLRQGQSFPQSSPHFPGGQAGKEKAISYHIRFR